MAGRSRQTRATLCGQLEYPGSNLALSKRSAAVGVALDAVGACQGVWRSAAASPVNTFFAAAAWLIVLLSPLTPTPGRIHQSYTVLAQ